MKSKLRTILFLILLLSACTTQPNCLPPATPAATATKPIRTETSPVLKTTELKPEKKVSESQKPYPNLWKKINKDKITLYPYNLFTDYAVAKDGSLWLTGGFGVVHQDLNGQQTWYSIKNGLPLNLYSVVAVSPKDEIWIGGSNNALFRFNGQQWIDEGEKLSQPFDDREDIWLCYSKLISGIDFGPDGSAWVMNNGIELYRQAYGQWVNIPFPKNFLPVAGGGACPKGLRVKTDNDITIKIGPNGEANPSGYQFDGQTWSRTKDYGAVDQLLNSKHSLNKEIKQIGDSILSSGLTDWPFSSNSLLPDSLHPSSRYSNSLITTDNKGMIWLYDGSVSLYNLSNPQFSLMVLNGSDNIDPKQSLVFGFGTKVIYVQEGKYPKPFESLLPETIRYYINGIPLTVDDLDRIWFYYPEKGLVTVDHGDVNILGQIPGDQVLRQPGGVLQLEDGRIWIGGQGTIWELNKIQWQKFILPLTKQTFTHFVQDKQGIIYGATGEGVYQFDGLTYQYAAFVAQNYKLAIIPNDGRLGDCSFHKRYVFTANCPSWWGNASSDYQYEVRYLGVQPDGAITYINNHVVARLKNGEWKSFAFDTFSIDSATVDRDGNIWILSSTEGLIKLEANIFDDYQKLIID